CAHRRSGLAVAAGGRAVPVLTGYGQAVGRPVSCWPGVDRPQLQAADLAEPVAGAERAAHRCVALHAPVGSAPDRVSPAPGPLDGRAGPGQVPDGEAGQYRPGHWTSCAQAQGGALRGRCPWAAGARGHQEAGRLPASSCRIRTVVSTGSTGSSASSALRTQLRRVTLPTPVCPAIRAIAPGRLAGSRRASTANRVARSPSRWTTSW